MKLKNKEINKTTERLIIMWSIPLILIVVICKITRWQAENYQGNIEDIRAMFLFVGPLLIVLIVTIGIFVFSICHLVNKKRQGMDTLNAMKPLIIFLITVSICFIIDGKAIFLFLTEYKMPFWPQEI